MFAQKDMFLDDDSGDEPEPPHDQTESKKEEYGYPVASGKQAWGNDPVLGVNMGSTSGFESYSHNVEYLKDEPEHSKARDKIGQARDYGEVEGAILEPPEMNYKQRKMNEQRMKYKAKQEEKNYMGGVAAAEEDDWYSGMAKSKQQFKDPYNQPPPQVVAPPKTVPQSTYNEDPIEDEEYVEEIKLAAQPKELKSHQMDSLGRNAADPMQGMEKEFATKPVIVGSEDMYYTPKEQIPVTVVEEEGPGEQLGPRVQGSMEPRYDPNPDPLEEFASPSYEQSVPGANQGLSSEVLQVRDDYIRKLTDIGMSVEERKEFMMQPIPREVGVLKCHISRYKTGLKHKIYPKYELYHTDTEYLILTAKKRSIQRTPNYLLTIDHKNLTVKTKGYLGKIRGNFVGTEFNFYDHGVNPSTKKPLDLIREQVGSILYESNIFGSKGPRKMTVMLPMIDQEDKRTMWKPNNEKEGMIQCYKNKVTESLIMLKNKEPKWNTNLQAYVLNFGGRVKLPSVKNFIITDAQGDTIAVIWASGQTQIQFGYSMAIFTLPGTCYSCELPLFQMGL